MATELMKIVLIRPGATPFDEEGRIKGRLDLPLSDSGRRQVAELANRLARIPWEGIYAAPSEAARETAAEIAQHGGVRVRCMELLENLDYGLWQGKLIAEVKRTQPRVYRSFQEAPARVCPPCGEPVVHAIERAEAALGRIVRKHRQGSVAVVVSQPFGAIFKSVATGAPLADLWSSELDFGTWETLVLERLALVAH